MARYLPDVISTVDDEMVHLKFVESMKLEHEDANLVIDKLKGDVILIVTGISGTKHLVSMNKILKMCNDTESTHKEMADAVFEKWAKIHSTGIR